MINVRNKVALYSLCLSFGSNFSLLAQNEIAIDLSEDFIILCDRGDDEIYPIEDADTICTLDEIQNYIDDLEFDPSNSYDESETQSDDDKDELQSIVVETIDIIELPCAPADIIILGQDNEEEQSITAVVDIHVKSKTEAVKNSSLQAPIMLQVDFTDTSFDAQDLDLFCESDYILPELVEEAVEKLISADAKTVVIDANQVPTEVTQDVVTETEITAVQDEMSDTMLKSKKKAKKKFFHRSKKNKDKK